MNPSSNPVRCQAVDFDLLLFGDDNSAVFRSIAEHVESCDGCQARLAQLAADDTQWAAARSFLNPANSGPTIDLSLKHRLMDSKGELRVRPAKLDFLSTPSHPELLGRLGRYDIERVVGSGGMGIVLKGFDTELNRPVAIKVLSPHLAHSAAARQRFAREARAAASIVHEHVVAIHDVAIHDVVGQQESPYLVMQYVGGQSLAERVDEQGPLSPAEILRIGIQAAAGLSAAHSQGVIHRDVKPANILLENGVDRAMLADFGLARAADDATLTHSGILAGTPYYMSPEQARGEVLDARSDLFSLGSVLYFMATGHPPFRAEQAMAILLRVCNDTPRPVQEVNAAIPDELADMIDRLLEKKPNRRYASAEELQQALSRALVRLQQPPSTNVRRWVRKRYRRWRAAINMAACLAALAAGTWTLSHFMRGASVEKIPEFMASESVVALQGEIVDEVSELKNLLFTAEGRAAPAMVQFNARTDAWNREINMLKTEISRLEKRWSPIDENPLEFPERK